MHFDLITFQRSCCLYVRNRRVVVACLFFIGVIPFATNFNIASMVRSFNLEDFKIINSDFTIVTTTSLIAINDDVVVIVPIIDIKTIITKVEPKAIGKKVTTKLPTIIIVMEKEKKVVFHDEVTIIAIIVIIVVSNVIVIKRLVVNEINVINAINAINAKRSYAIKVVKHLLDVIG